jgi:hypothetical protein
MIVLRKKCRLPDVEEFVKTGVHVGQEVLVDHSGEGFPLDTDAPNSPGL